jgi:hypothetical protein
MIQRIPEVGQNAGIEVFSREQQFLQSAQLGYRLGEPSRDGDCSG